ncbi:MAG: hypothetical protein ABIA67_02290 [Candidatus Margulisiibacteriota bacterium]
MKKCLVFLVCLVLLSPVVTAQVLTGAIPNDPGVWSIALIGAQQSNVSNDSRLSQTIYGIAAAYGLCDRTELDLVYESGVFSGVPGMEMSLYVYSLSIKYNLLMEAPVSVALGANYTLLSQKDNYAGSPNGNNYGYKILVSKVISSLLPYACLAQSYTSLGGDSNAVEATAGVMWLATGKISLMAENTWQLQSDGYTSALFSLGAAYTF